MSKIARITMFKLPEASDIQELIQKYSTLTQDAKKPDGKPYIESASASRPHADPRNQGYTLVCRTVFASRADMGFYDDECEAHAAIKAFVKPRSAGPALMVYMDV